MLVSNFFYSRNSDVSKLTRTINFRCDIATSNQLKTLLRSKLYFLRFKHQPTTNHLIKFRNQSRSKISIEFQEIILSHCKNIIKEKTLEFKSIEAGELNLVSNINQLHDKFCTSILNSIDLLRSDDLPQIFLQTFLGKNKRT